MNYTETVYNETIEIKCIKYVIMDILIDPITSVNSREKFFQNFFRD